MGATKLRFTNSAYDFDAAIQTFLFSCKARNLSNETLTFYINRLDSFRRFLSKELPDIKPADVTPDTIRRFITYCQDALKHSVQTVNHNIQVLHTFFGYLEDEGHIEASPMRKIKKIRQRKQIVQTFSSDELKRLLAQPDQNTFLGLRDYAMMLLLLDAGCRVSEVWVSGCRI